MIKGDKMNEEETNEEAEVDELYRDVNVNLEGRDTKMTDAPLPNVQGTQVTEDTRVIITALVNPKGIDIIFTLNTEATSLVDVSVTTTAEPPLLSATTLPPTPLITHLQQTPIPTPATAPSSLLQDLPNFGSLFSLVELEYLFEEVYKATTDQLDWSNPEVTKTKATDYGHIKWIEDLVPNRMWSQVPVSYDKHALWGISHWGRKRQQFYGFAANRESARDVYSKRRIIAVTKLEIVDWHNYKHLDWITVRRDDDKLYKFKEGDFNRLRIQDIKDMLLFLIQGKLINLTVEERLAFNQAHLTKPYYIPDLKRREAYTAYSNPRGFIYQNKDKKNRLMRIDELHKFSDGTLNDVRTALNDRLKGIWMGTSRVNSSIHNEDGKPCLFYTSVGNPVKEILLKLNLPDHRILKDGGKGT
ncbi:hypothetical protein Tco_0152043 [Tanacetum coccineum]